MILIVVGCILGITALMGRAIAFEGRSIELGRRFYLLLAVSVIGTLLAFKGLYDLANATPVPTLPLPSNAVDYSQILTVLSLLAAGIVTGYFTFTFQEAADDECWLATAISACFVILFYSVFGALSLYIGKSAHIRASEHASTLLPFIMWLLLLANALYDFWDYRDV
jgi:hypothetical protein